MTHKTEGSILRRRDFLRGLVVAILGAIAGGSFLFRDELLIGRLFRRKPNIQEDISETHNVADEHPEIVNAIAEIMEMAHTPSVEFPTNPDWWGGGGGDSEED
jgi:hypothetical protein